MPDLTLMVCGRHSDDGVSASVSEMFNDYQNHYASNPFLDRRAALDGYLEWAQRAGRDAGGYVTIDYDEVLGFGVIDWNARPPDVRLAGLTVRARGRGRYRDLVVA